MQPTSNRPCTTAQRHAQVISARLAVQARDWKTLQGDHHGIVLAGVDKGFDVGLTYTAGVWIVTLCGWDEELDNMDEALNLVGGALAGTIRVTVDGIADRPVRWLVEHYNESTGQWYVIGCTLVFRLRFGRRQWTRTYQNSMAVSNLECHAR
jgi:hypothetical protein